MTQSKKKIYGAVLAIALVAVVVDRLLIGDPAGAEGATAGTAPASIGALLNAGGSEDAPAEANSRPIFPKQLPPMAWSSVLRDPFELPDELAQRRDKRLSGGVEVAVGTPVRQPGEPLIIAQFIETHRVTGILAGEIGAAIVDNKTVEVGEKFDESELLRVEGDKAYFQCQDGVAVLKIFQD